LPDDQQNIDLNEFESFFAVDMQWASLSVTVREIAADNESLVRDLSGYDPIVAIPLLASLLTVPEYQSQCIRLEVLVFLAVSYCTGRKKANIADVVRWFSQIGKSKCVAGEDPAEDVFVSLVTDQYGNYRLIEGIWEAAGFYTQRVFEVISTMPDDGIFGQIKRSFHALLIISDMVCEKAGLRRYQLGSEEKHSLLSPGKIPGTNILLSRVTISFEELSAKGVNLLDIEPFLLHRKMKAGLAKQQIGYSDLDRRPLIILSDTHLIVALPSAISIAVRDFAITCIIAGELVDTFNSALATNYSMLFTNTPLLGSPLRAPVYWKKLGQHRLSTFTFEVDQGYYISYHLFLTSVETHVDGGFKYEFEDEGELTSALKQSIDDMVKQFSARPNFKEGLIVLVGCGWGKGYVTKTFEINYPKWHFESMSAADLVRLSWLDDMSPSYFWRIQDGLEAVTKSGIKIINPNGILNLIGWVRSNNGHFVPHEHLIEEEVSPERPLRLVLPFNLLRKVRFDADNSYDRHRAIDNIGVWHDVQHKTSDPFFSSESSLRLYVSMDYVQNGMLTSVYEGRDKLWLSLVATNISNSEIKFHLWDMANEWLHRIGSTLDRYTENLTKKAIFKVYVEFQDVDPPNEPIAKPSKEYLRSLCLVEEHGEPNAIDAVFKAGFISGFSIAENVAERLFVFNLARAFLHLIVIKDIDKEAEKITTLVVQNQEARSFHIFHTQEFIDYVRDTLPRKLVTIDKIDYAAAKIGLGWRINERYQGNKIEGREECVCFLGRVVDNLLAEIFDMLASFERVSTLIRLVGNSEKASAEKEYWKQTSAALIGLHGHDDDTIGRCVSQMSKFAGAGIASRVLIEIALCVCPLKGGAHLSDIELSKLLVRASLVVSFGGISDAIYYNALPPEITISSLGDILFLDDFGELVVEPMLYRALSDKFIADAPLQYKNYDDPVPVETITDKIDDEFQRIWTIEMGFDLDQARTIIDVLENKGISDNSAIFIVSKSEYFSLVCSNKIVKDVAERFLERFSLTTRQPWDKPPKGYANKDIYPWRYGRRLSFAARPILTVNECDDAILIIAPNALRSGFAYVVDGAYNSCLEQSFFRTKEMRNIWWGKAGEGHSFNAEVASRLCEAGWQIRQNIGIPEILNHKTDRDFGDIDVLAWRPDRNEILGVECKDLSLARNYSEIAALLSDYQGSEISGKPDSLKKHLIRISILKENTDKLRRMTGVQEPMVVSCLVFSGIVPMQYAKIEALAETHIGSTKDILNKFRVEDANQGEQEKILP